MFCFTEVVIQLLELYCIIQSAVSVIYLSLIIINRVDKVIGTQYKLIAAQTNRRINSDHYHLLWPITLIYCRTFVLD